MENPFKKILHNEEVPKALRKKVINDISLIKLSIDMADLFVVKYPSTVGEFLDTEKKPIKNIEIKDFNKDQF